MRCLSVSAATQLVSTVWRAANCTRLNQHVTVRKVIWMTTILIILNCLMHGVYFINSRKGGSSTNKYFWPQLWSQSDTLGELNSAGYETRQISERLTTPDRTRNRSQLKESSSQNSHNESYLLVPNVVHYVWLGSDLKFKFIHYLSFLSVHRYIVPRYIFVHGESEPTGYWWNRTVYDVDNIVHVKHAARTHAPNGKAFAYKAHASDVIRTEVIFSK